jgi:hypothetical protein
MLKLIVGRQERWIGNHLQSLKCMEVAMPGDAGGSAMQGGALYQNQVAAYLAVLVLAEQAAALPFDFPSDVNLEYVASETSRPVDDVMAITSVGGGVYIQAKTRISASKSSKSEFGKTIAQFVNQYLDQKDENGDGLFPWQRAFDKDLDRLILATSRGSSGSIVNDLPKLLEKVRSVSPFTTFDNLNLNQKEKTILSKIKNLIYQVWKGRTGSKPTDDEVVKLLCLIRVLVWDFGPSEQQEGAAKERLKTAILKNPLKADAAWGDLVNACAKQASIRTGAYRSDWQKYLLDLDYDIQAVTSYRNDIKRLRDIANQTIQHLLPCTQIKLADNVLKVERPVSEALYKAAQLGSVALVGMAGGGKSGALVNLALRLLEENVDLILIRAQDVPNKSSIINSTALGLEFSLPMVLENWPGTQPAYLLIDALDAARSSIDQRSVIDLIKMAQRTDRWKVVASVRTYDLIHSRGFKDCFAGHTGAGPEFIDPALKALRHIHVGPFTDVELKQMFKQNSDLNELWSKSSEKLKEILRVPFNINLAAELLESQATPESLGTISNQIELLDRYWDARIEVSAHEARERKRVLHKIINKLVDSRRLQVEQSSLANEPLSEESLSSLISDHVLNENNQFNKDTIQFSHHILFDYFVEKLYCTADDIIEKLTTEPDIAIFIRPSLDFYFQRNWYASTDRKIFWHEVFNFMASKGLPETAKLIGPAQVVILAECESDCDPLVAELNSGANAGILSFRHLVQALLADPKKNFESYGQCIFWSKLVNRAAQNDLAKIAYAIANLLRSLIDAVEELGQDVPEKLGAAVRALANWAWHKQNHDRWLITQTIRDVCRTFGSGPIESAKILRRFLEPERLAAHAHEDLSPLSRGLKHIVGVDPEFIEEIYQKSI